MKIENDYIIKEINNPLYVNTYRAFVSQEQKRQEFKEYMEEHKEYFKEKGHEYYTNNKYKISERNKKYYAEKND